MKFGRLIFFLATIAILSLGAAYLLASSNKKTTSPLSITPKTTIEQPTASPTKAAQKVVGTVFVTLTPSGFSPHVISILPGTRIVWTNTSGVQATINSDPHPTHTAYPPLNLGQFGKTNRLSLIFTKAGTYGYHNHFDASQTGTIIVQ